MLILPEHSITTLDTIHHADCFDLMNGLASQSVDAIITDMPYGTTACSWDTRVDFEQWWNAVKRVLKPRGVMVTTASQPFTSALVMSNPEWFRYEWIWKKNRGSNFLNAKIEPMKEHEEILIFSDGIPKYYPQQIERIDKERAKYVYRADNSKRDGYGAFDFPERKSQDILMRVPSSVIYYTTENGLHFNQKPVALYEYLIKTYTQPGDIILDPFAGSGTTSVAARKTGRHYICGDSDAGYVALARRRLSDSDPFQPTQVSPTEQQLSLWSNQKQADL